MIDDERFLSIWLERRFGAMVCRRRSRVLERCHPSRPSFCQMWLNIFSTRPLRSVDDIFCRPTKGYSRNGGRSIRRPRHVLRIICVNTIKVSLSVFRRTLGFGVYIFGYVVSWWISSKTSHTTRRGVLGGVMRTYFGILFDCFALLCFACMIPKSALGGSHLISHISSKGR
jgi:hypothetical protein